MMPTTRRGRYLFYRDRAERRERRSNANRPRPGDNAFHTLNRSHDTRGLAKQAAWPGTPKRPWQPAYWSATPDDDPLKGTYRHPGIVLDTTHPFSWWSPNTHVRDRWGTYYMRRQKRIPMLRNLPLRPFLTPTGPFAFQHHYPFYRYPSGQLNANWWLGVDDDGNPPPPH